MRVVLPDGTRRAVYLDGWVDVRFGQAQECLALGEDRGTEEQNVWGDKNRPPPGVCRRPLSARLRHRGPHGLIVATPGPRRVAQLLRWTEAELTRQRASREDSELFWFTAADPAAGPETFFFTPVWYQPFVPEPRALWERPGG